jgi:BirA family biotin operon repressor/biotin-[acetyl-CoA-carboxylase] ligase
VTFDLRIVEETGSTQDDARALAVLGAAHGTTVVARRQTNGRGRRGRSWHAGEHGLWLSVVLRVDVPMVMAPRLPIAACVAIGEVLWGRGLGVAIKWPNDLLVPAENTGTALGPFRKAGGLILEAVDVADGRLRCCVLGLGINLVAPEQGFPAEVAATAGTLSSVGFVDAGDAGRLALAHDVVGAVSALAARIDDDPFFDVLAVLRQRSATIGRRVTVEGLSGRAIDFDVDGALVVLDDHGRRHTIRAGDVALL